MTVIRRRPLAVRLCTDGLDPGLRLALDIPGVDSQFVRISLANRVLTIRGEMSRKVEEKAKPREIPVVVKRILG